MTTSFFPTSALNPVYCVNVELDIFSGRPNPSFVLNPHEITVLEEKLHELSFGTPKEFPSNLGYRGFRISLTQQPLGFPSNVEVFDSYINATGEWGQIGCPDTEGLEKWLIRIAQERGYQNIIQEGRAGKQDKV